MVAYARKEIGLARLVHQLKAALAQIAHVVVPWYPWIGLVGLTAVMAFLAVRLVIWPGYVHPNSRMYSSQLGYAAMLRRQERPFPVQTSHAEVRALRHHYVGEGFIRSAPVLVPVIPASRIERVCVQEGETVKKGQLLVQLDATQARLRLDAARVMLEVAQAELERTRIGSAYLLEKERPEQDSIRVQSAEDQAQVQDELNRMSQRLFEKGVVSRSEMLEQRLSLIQTLAGLRQAETALNQSQAGRKQSVRIAEGAVREAELAVAQRELELAEHDVFAPADGVIERRLVHEGEYNQDPGKPAFLLAAGQWFEAYFDQTVSGQLAVGDGCTVRLEAHPGVDFPGKITAIHPFIAYRASGPETTRPIRPSGSGAPEWPSTFSVRIELDGQPPSIYSGLSGFAKVVRDRQALAIPSSAVLSASSGAALVLVRAGHYFESRSVLVGTRQDGWTEIRDGLKPTDEVLIEGHHVLKPGDRIHVAGSRQATSTSS